ncbi:MAG TPA: GntP family permease [Pseudomonas xinjiangensis]|uniref:GntP family permease n=2 Tax=root TaxID=1 RepID=A0A7V1BQB2_9GAMM|nr:GntP family permease [Halopseudomonas xinjiangensis]HEC48201.1 GntP family permease [Halopseudomonas xinjiangensis]
MLGNLGLLAGLALLIFLALRGVNIFIASLVCSLVVAVTNGLLIPRTLLEHYPFGSLGAFSFAGRFFLLFLCGAIFGKAMATSQAAKSIALAITRSLGVRHTLLVGMVVCALLTYGGVVVFVVVFTMYPLGITLMREANLPKRLWAAATSVGAGTFTMTALPGTPSIHNVISASALGTDLFAGGWIGIFAALIMAGLGMWYVEHSWKVARANGEGFVENAQDRRMEQLIGDPSDAPPWYLAIIPLVTVLGVIMVPRLLIAVGDWGAESLMARALAFSQAQSIIWPSMALIIGSLACVVLFPSMRRKISQVFGQGAEDSIMPLFNTAAVIGFGGVVTQTLGFSQFAQWMLNADLPPLLSIFASASVVSAIVGSASGGLQIFMQTLAPQYLEMGVEPEILHRIAAIASGGLDSLPHCGAVIATFMIMGLTHREAYKDMFAVTVAVPVIACLASIALLMLMGVGVNPSV